MYLGRGHLTSLIDFVEKAASPVCPWPVCPWPVCPLACSTFRPLFCQLQHPSPPKSVLRSVAPVASATREQFHDLSFSPQETSASFCSKLEKLLGFPHCWQRPSGALRTGLSCVQPAHLVTQTLVLSFLPKRLSPFAAKVSCGISKRVTLTPLNVSILPSSLPSFSVLGIEPRAL